MIVVSVYLNFDIWNAIGNRYPIQDYRLIRAEKTTSNRIRGLSALPHVHADEGAVFFIGPAPYKLADLGAGFGGQP
jgi:hypothetical protein